MLRLYAEARMSGSLKGDEFRSACGFSKTGVHAWVTDVEFDQRHMQFKTDKRLITVMCYIETGVREIHLQWLLASVYYN